jgi:hypothetical protein
MLFYFQGCNSTAAISSTTVEIAGNTYQLELALNRIERERGLMGRTHLPENGGMLFVFPDASERSFWMKNCYFDIDLIFLDSRGTVMSIHRMLVEPPKGKGESPWIYEGRLENYLSHGPSRFAIELTAGSLDRLEIGINDKIVLDLPLLKKIAR